MKKLPLGIQSFRKLIEEDCVYVDKTHYIYDLINGASCYFLSRPRRFGKSLLLDTIGEVLSGNKELFKGLWIYDSSYAFEEHQVIRLDMSNISNETPEILKTAMLLTLQERIQDEGFDISGGILSHTFKRLIELLYRKYGQKVVVLIDEYDKPILDHIDDIATAEANRKVIRGFYGILKSMDPYLRFTFITGVSKFTKTSLFSELNNLTDITMEENYADICGIPVECLDFYFTDHINNLKTHKRFKSCESIRDKILEWYDGYSWDGESKLLNPFSLLNFFNSKKFSGFWYSSGTPKLLLDYIRKHPESYTNLKNTRITESMLDSVDIANITIEPVLFQTGYLTVTGIPPTSGMPIYEVDIPNFEVRDAFSLHVLAALTESNDVRAGQARLDIDDALKAGDLQKMLETLRRLFASIPYQLQGGDEAYYHSIFYVAMKVLGFDMDVEVPVSKGRVDAVLELDDYVYVMEFKYESCAPDASKDNKQQLFDKALDKAMCQIKDRGYHKKYIGSGKTVYLAAFAFLGRDDIEMKVESVE